MAAFWTIVEKNTVMRVPKYLKNILMLNGYDDALSIESITTKDIDLFEEFVRNEIDIFIGVNDDPKDFYHIFWDKKDKFKIMKGDRVKLMDVVEFVRKNLASETGHYSFKQAEKTIQQTSGQTLNSHNYKQNYKNQPLDIKDCLNTTPQFLKPSTNIIFKEISGETEMVTEELLIRKHEHLDPQIETDPRCISSTENLPTALMSQPSNAQLVSLTDVTNTLPAQRSSNTDANAISRSSIPVGQDPHVDDESETNMQKGVSSSVSVQLQNISFGQNQQINTGHKPYACDVCQKSFTQHGKLKRHQNIHTGQKPYACNVCQRAFSQSTNLKAHQRIHSSEKPYICDVCQRAFRHSSTLSSHKKTHTGQKDYVCDVCQKAFSHTSTLRKHKRIHSGEKPYACNVCLRAFVQNKDLKAHQRIHSGEKPYICDVCQRAFKQSSSLSTHKRIHIGQKDYVCDFCQRAFGQIATLKAHQRIHSGEKPYACDVCRKAFSQLSTLKAHQTIHTGQKDYVCDVCQKAFGHISTLKKHKRTHYGEKPYACDVCQKTFTQLSTLKAHQRIHTGPKDYVCDVCQKAFKHHKNLKRHQMIHTGSTP